MTLGERIANLRTKNNLSQQELAELLSVTRQTVSKWESGSTVPGLDNIIRISDLFSVSTEYLLKGVPDVEAAKETEEDAKPVFRDQHKTKLNSRTTSEQSTKRKLIPLIPIIAIGVCLIVVGVAVFLPRWITRHPENSIELDESSMPSSNYESNSPVPSYSDSPDTFDEVQAIEWPVLANSVLYLEVFDETNNLVGTASGFLVNDGITLVTNYHVIEPAYRIIATTADGKKKTACNTVLVYSEVADLAVLQCENNLNLPPLELSDSDTILQGDAVYAIGYPLGIANTLSSGIVSSIYNDENGISTIQITAPISSGSSGGAVLDEAGKVVGIICAYYEHGQNLNISIAVSELIKLLEQASESSKMKLYELNKQDYTKVTVTDLHSSPKHYDGCLVTFTAWIGYYAYQTPDASDNYEEVIMIDDEKRLLGGNKISSLEDEFPELYISTYYYGTIIEYHVHHVVAVIKDSYLIEKIPKRDIKMTIYGKFTYNPDYLEGRYISDPFAYQVEVYSYFIEE
jgi:Trypsin-like serine proteases, typically periplasmic, contain C-terminal PDZ domain